MCKSLVDQVRGRAPWTQNCFKIFTDNSKRSYSYNHNPKSKQFCQYYSGLCVAHKLSKGTISCLLFFKIHFVLLHISQLVHGKNTKYTVMLSWCQCLEHREVNSWICLLAIYCQQLSTWWRGSIRTCYLRQKPGRSFWTSEVRKSSRGEEGEGTE